MATPEELYERIAEQVRAAAPPDWTNAQVRVLMLASQSQMDTVYHTSSGPEAVSREIGFGALDAFEELRELLAQPGKGAWYTAVFQIDPQDEFHIDFDYDGQPQFSHTIDDEDYLDDLKQYPRSAEAIPAWMPTPA